MLGMNKKVIAVRTDVYESSAGGAAIHGGRKQRPAYRRGVLDALAYPSADSSLQLQNPAGPGIAAERGDSAQQCAE